MNPNQPNDRNQAKPQDAGQGQQADRQQSGSQQSQQPGSQQQGQQQQRNPQQGSQQQGNQQQGQQSGGQHASGGTPALDDRDDMERGESARQASEAFKQSDGQRDKR